MLHQAYCLIYVGKNVTFSDTNPRLKAFSSNLTASSRVASRDSFNSVSSSLKYFVVVYNVTIVAIGHGLLMKFWPLVIGCVLRTAGNSII